MRLTYQAHEALIKEAIVEIHRGVYKNIRQAAIAKHISETRLRNRYNLKLSKSSRKAASLRLSDTQEQALCDYIDHLDDIEHLIRLSHIRGAAKHILRLAAPPGTSPPSLGLKWVTRFLKRHPQYLKRKQKPLSAERKNAHDVESIEKFFTNFKAVIDDKGI